MLTQVVQSNDTLRELTFCVIEDENLRKRRDASRSDPPKIVVCKPSQRPESPLSILKKTGKKRNVDVNLRCDDTL